MNAAQWAAILAHPDDDDVRLTIADDLQRAGDARGEFIRLQVPRAAADRRSGRRRRSLPSGREFELLRQHGARWAAEVGPCVNTRGDALWGSFHRGFVAAVTVATVTEAEQALRSTPVEHVSCGVRGADYRAFLGPDLVRRIHGLTLWDVTSGDDIAFVAAGQPALSGLRSLGLQHNGIGPAGIAALIASPHLAAVPVVDLRLNDPDPRDQVSYDEAGYAVKTYPCALARTLEAQHGQRPWLHRPWDRAEDEPDGWIA